MAKEVERKFLYVPKKERIRVRFIGKQGEMYQYFRLPTAPPAAPPAAPTAPSGLLYPFVSASSQSDSFSRKPIFKEIDDGDTNYSRSKRIVSLVVDREDDKIRAFACPISVWNMITHVEKENDFEIWREGDGLQTRYFANPLGPSEITDDHEKIVEATLESYTFANIFVDNEWELVETLVERIENRWDILDL